MPPEAAPPSTEEAIVQELFARIGSGEFARDPYPSYRMLREHSPAVRLGDGSWILTGFHAVYGALRDHAAFSSRAISDQGPDVESQVVLISDDPPRHTRLRGLVNKAFTPRRVSGLEPRIAAITEQLLEHFAAAASAGPVEAMRTLAIPLPVTVIAELLGVERERHDDFKRWSVIVVSEETEENREAHEAELAEMRDYFQHTVDLRRAEPLKDLFSSLVQSELDGHKLEDWEVIGMATLLLVAGNETTTNLIGNALNVLAERPSLWEQLRADRELVPALIEETLRYDSPVQTLPRLTLRDVEVAGRTIEEGANVTVSFAAANRDPEGFEHPDEVRLDRDLTKHLALGHGIHYCLGSPLARAEAKIALNALLDRYSTLRPADEPGEHQRASFIVRGFTSLPLVMER